MTHIDPAQPFVEIDTPFDMLVSDVPGVFTLEIPVPGAGVDDLDLEVADPFLILYRGGSQPEVRSFVMLAHVDTDSIRAHLDQGLLRISARRRWTRERELPIMSNFLWGGHVGARPWDVEARRPHPESRGSATR
jgi:HSP20 family molecular chaperone IbpA